MKKGIIAVTMAVLIHVGNVHAGCYYDAQYVCHGATAGRICF